jgi:phytoene dehydrogenase-like protein
VTDVIVIGGGHNGLTAAGYLARSGLGVLVLERAGEVGGMCQTREVLRGFRGNMAVNSGHNLDPVVSADMRLEDFGLEWITVGDPSSVALLPGTTRLVSYRDPAKARAEYDKFAPGEADGYFAILEEMSALGRKLDVSFYDPPPHFADVAARVSPGREEDFFGRVMFGSALDVASERLASEQVRTHFCMLAVAGSLIGPSTPGSAYQMMQRPMYRGARVARQLNKVMLTPEFATRTPRGGMGAITQAMKRSIEAAGAKILTGAIVTEIKCGQNGTEGVVLEDGREFDAPIVVSAMNPISTLLDLLPENALDRELRSTLRQIPMQGCMAKIYLALDGEPQYATARDAEENAMLLRCGFRAGPTVADMDRSYHLALEGDWSGEPIIYGITQTALDTSLNPAGKHLMSLSVCYAPYRLGGGTWEDQKDDWIKHTIRALSEHMPNLEDIIVDCGALTPQNLEDEFGLREANALHGDVMTSRMFHWRPISGYSDYTTPVDGLYLCSNGTWPANYVTGLPGRNASLKIIADLKSNGERLQAAPDHAYASPQ